MDMYDLESFLAVVRRGNFSRAAMELSLTQPALSQRIKQLEAELGYPLLIRRKGCQAITLTERGARFVRTAEEILALWRGARQPSDKESRRQLRVSIIDSVMTCTIPALVHHFNQAYPDIDLILSSYHSLESYQRLEQGELDLAIVGKLSRTQGGLAYPVYSDPWVFICGQDAHYPEVIHPSSLNTDYQLLLCNKEADDWQEYWFSGQFFSLANARKISYVNRYLFEGETWAVLPSAIARYLERSANGVIHRMKDAPPPRITYMVQSGQADQELVGRFKACVYQELQQVPGILPLFSREDLEALPGDGTWREA